MIEYGISDAVSHYLVKRLISNGKIKIIEEKDDHVKSLIELA